MQAFQKVLRATGPRAVAATAAVATASTSTAHARAPPQAQLRERPFTKLGDADGWELADLKDEVVLFRPYDAREIDDALQQVSELVDRSPSSSSRTYPIITEVEEGSDCTDGVQADCVIEDAEDRYRVRNEDREQLFNLVQITSRLLQRPGMQAELVKSMLEDEELRGLVLAQSSNDNLEAYLAQGGFTPPLLLEGGNLVFEPIDGDDSDFFAKLVGAITSWVGKAGDAMGFLGGWLRDRLAFFNPQRGDEAAGSNGTASAGHGRSNTVDTVLGSAMMLAVAVFCMLVVKRPLVFRRA